MPCAICEQRYNKLMLNPQYVALLLSLSLSLVTCYVTAALEQKYLLKMVRAARTYGCMLSTRWHAGAEVAGQLIGSSSTANPDSLYMNRFS